MRGALEESMVPALLVLVFIVAFAWFMAYFKVSVWNECRAQGNSVLYCLKLVNGKAEVVRPDAVAAFVGEGV